MQWRSGPTWWSLQNRGSPRPRAARSAAGGRRRRPKAGDAFRGGATRPVPLTQNLRGENSSSPESFPRNASCPPRGRGNERFLLSFNGCARSARHRNILRGTLNSAVLHVNFPDSFARHKDYFVSDSRGCCSIVFRKTIRARPLSGRTPFSRARVPRISDNY